MTWSYKRASIAALGTAFTVIFYLVFAREKIAMTSNGDELIYFIIYLLVDFSLIFSITPYMKGLSIFRSLLIGLFAGYFVVLLTDILFELLIPGYMDVFTYGVWMGIMTYLFGAAIRFYWTMSFVGFLLVAILLRKMDS